MRYSELHIEYSDPANTLDPLTLRFKLNTFSIVDSGSTKL